MSDHPGLISRQRVQRTESGAELVLVWLTGALHTTLDIHPERHESLELMFLTSTYMRSCISTLR